MKNLLLILTAAFALLTTQVFAEDVAAPAADKAAEKTAEEKAAEEKKAEEHKAH